MGDLLLSVFVAWLRFGRSWIEAFEEQVGECWAVLVSMIVQGHVRAHVVLQLGVDRLRQLLQHLRCQTGDLQPESIAALLPLVGMARPISPACCTTLVACKVATPGRTVVQCLLGGDPWHRQLSAALHQGAGGQAGAGQVVDRLKQPVVGRDVHGLDHGLHRTPTGFGKAAAMAPWIAFKCALPLCLPSARPRSLSTPWDDVAFNRIAAPRSILPANKLSTMQLTIDWPRRASKV